MTFSSIINKNLYLCIHVSRLRWRSIRKRAHQRHHHSVTSLSFPTVAKTYTGDYAMAMMYVCTHLFHLIKSSSFIFFLSPNNIVPLSLWWKLNEGEEIYCFRYILCIHGRLKRYYIISHKLSVPLGFGIFHLMSFDWLCWLDVNSYIQYYIFFCYKFIYVFMYMCTKHTIWLSKW